jgi:hypothetical protein
MSRKTDLLAGYWSICNPCTVIEFHVVSNVDNITLKIDLSRTKKEKYTHIFFLFCLSHKGEYGQGLL